MSVRVVLCTLACIQVHFAVRDDVDSLELAAVADKHLAEQSFEESKSGESLAEATDKLTQNDAMQQMKKTVSVGQKQDTKPLQARGGVEPLTTGMLIGMMVAVAAAADSACGKANQGLKTAEAFAECGQNGLSKECFRKMLIISNCGDVADACYTGFTAYAKDKQKEIEEGRDEIGPRPVCSYESKAKPALLQQHDASEANVTAATSEPLTMAGLAAVFLAAETACGIVDKRVKVDKSVHTCLSQGFSFQCAKDLAHIHACGETAFRVTAKTYTALETEAKEFKKIYDEKGAGPAFVETYERWSGFYEEAVKDISCWNGKLSDADFNQYCLDPFLNAFAQALR